MSRGEPSARQILLAVLALTLALAHYCRKGRLSATRVACSEPAQRAVRLPGVVADRGAGLPRHQQQQQQQQHRHAPPPRAPPLAVPAVRRRQAARGAGHAARVDVRGRARRGGGRARGPARTARRPGRRARGRPPRRYQICSPKTPLSRPSWGPRTAATSPQRRTRAERIRTRAGARRRESPTRTARLRPDFGDLGGADRDGDRAARQQKKSTQPSFHRE